MTETFVVYQRGSSGVGAGPVDAAGLAEWMPSLGRVRPNALIADHDGFAKNWIFHLPALALGRTPYRVYLLRNESGVVAQCLLSGSSVRFPFMEPGDLQIGLVHTCQAQRNQGLARRMVTAVIGRHQDCPRFWWLTTHDNVASRKVADACGFTLAGEARRISRFGIPHFLLSTRGS